jgi:hypothetical protein
VDHKWSTSKETTKINTQHPTYKHRKSTPRRDQASGSTPQKSLPVVVPRGHLTLQIVVWNEDEGGEEIIGHWGGIVAILEPHFNRTSFISEAILGDHWVQHQLVQLRVKSEEEEADLVGDGTKIIRGRLNGDLRGGWDGEGRHRPKR